MVRAGGASVGPSGDATLRHLPRFEGEKREGGEYCLRHSMAKWPYSTARWQRLRQVQLQAEPLCRKCSRLEPATVVDHVTPHRGDPQLAFDPANLQSLCKPHHDAAKAIEEHHGYSPAVGDDGWPTDSRHPANRKH